ncbi:MAG: D-cysteine desulfhydrase family protein, partial [Spirochaetaceae bacterium]|nr:D-cysteine desulfhydrase family protein [Spirochaetaceae bacterium]
MREDKLELGSVADALPRYDLALLPTPIEEMPRLSRALGGPRLFVKRDDQTGLAGGGNKTRKLEFTLGEAIKRGADTLITLGGVQSNHCRQTAAAAARAGLRCILVLRGHPPAQWNGNLLLDRLLGAQLRFSDDRSREIVAAEVFEEERKAGRRPFMIPLGASDEFGSPGYAFAARELALQLKETGLRLDRLVLASSSFGTQAGLCVGAKALGLDLAITGIAIDASERALQEGVAKAANATARRMGLDLDFAPAEIIGYDGYLGGGYAVMGEPEIEALGLAARCEGLVLDPVYTGRAMAGLMDLIRKGEFGRDE